MIQRPFNVAVCIEKLHLIDMLRSFLQLLNNKAGIYGFQNIETGEIVYIGSAVNLWKRLMQHITGRNSNVILQKAFGKYGLASFRFLVFVFIPLEEQNSKTEGRASLLSAEQLYLDSPLGSSRRLDSFNPRYNILTVAGSSLGYTHTPETALRAVRPEARL
jgi:group I intron endonuclease